MTSYPDLSSFAWIRPTQRVLDFNGPHDVPYRPLDVTWFDRPIIELLDEVGRRLCGRISVDDGVIRLTLGQLRSMACRLSHVIAEAQLRPGPVGVLLPDNAMYLVGIFGCLAAGRACIPLNRDNPANYNASLLGTTRAAGLVVLAIDTLVVPSTPTIAIEAALVPGGAEADSPSGYLGPDEPAFIFTTSGSSGTSKCVAKCQRGVLHRIGERIDAGHFNESDRVLVLHPVATAAGDMRFDALLSGASLHIVDLRRSGIGEVRRVLLEHRITVLRAPQLVLKALARLDDAQEVLGSLRLVWGGGDVLLHADYREIRASLPPECHYANPLSMTEGAAAHWFVPPLDDHDPVRVASGYLVPGSDALVLDEAGHPCSSGEPGELVIRSRYLALGDWQGGFLVTDRFPADPIDPSRRIYHTGDMVRLCSDGVVVVLGRTDRMVKVRGHRVEPAIIEAAICGVDGVAEAQVLARQEGTDIQLIAFVVPHATAPDGLAGEIRARLKAVLPGYMQPARIWLIDALPLLRSGKVDAGALLAADATPPARRGCAAIDPPTIATADPLVLTGPRSRDQQLPHLPVSPRIQDAVKRAWTAACGARSVARELAWEDAGGDSLRALQMLLQIEEDLGLRLSTDVLSVGMTASTLCAAIAQFIDQAPQGDPSPTADDRRITVFLMPGIVYDEPDLARFRLALRDRIRFVVIGYPNWREMIAAKAEFEAVVSDAFSQILTHCGDHPICLAGYSFGGFVAFAAAHRLIATGHRVSFLGLLDPRRQSSMSTSLLVTVIRRMTLIQRVRLHLQTRDFAVVLRLILRILLELRAFGLLERLATLCMKIDSRRAVPHLIYVLRSYTMRGWRPKALSVPTFFFRSEDDPQPQQDELDWSALCSTFSVVPVAGDHETMLAATNTERLCALFLDALRTTDANNNPLPAAPLTE
jgi:acyl-coenzyme A synthetase/AMP-(fatty) acid ligase/thioesterase domain-containing protein